MKFSSLVSTVHKKKYFLVSCRFQNRSWTIFLSVHPTDVDNSSFNIFVGGPESRLMGKTLNALNTFTFGMSQTNGCSRILDLP